MDDKHIKSFLTGFGLILLMAGQFLILGGKGLITGIILSALCVFCFFLAFTEKYSIFINFMKKAIISVTGLLAAMLRKRTVIIKKSEIGKKKSDNDSGSKRDGAAPLSQGFSVKSALEKLGKEGIGFVVPRWFFPVASIIIFGIAQFFFFTGSLMTSLMLLVVAAILLGVFFMIKDTGVYARISLGSGLKVLSMMAGLALIVAGWIMLLNMKIKVQEMGVVFTIPGCILAYLGLPKKREQDDLHEPQEASDILFLKAGILNNYFVKAGMLILAFISLRIGIKVMQDLDYNMYSMIFFGISIALLFFLLPLFNFSEKPSDNRTMDIIRLVFVIAALFLAYLGQRDFVANRVEPATLKFLIAAFAFIIFFPVYKNKIPEEKEPLPVKIEVIFMVLIMALSVYLRLKEIDSRPFGLENDEAGGYTARISNSGEPTLPLSVGNFGIHVHIVQLFILMFGELNRISIKMLGVVVGIVSIPMMYFFIRSVISPRAAIFATTLFAVLRWNLHYSRSGHSAVLMNAAEIAAFYFFFKAIETRKPFIWFMAGLALGLTWHGVLAGFLLIIPVILYFVISAFSRKDFFKSNAIGIFAFVFGFWIFGSMIVHNYFLSKSIYFARVGEVSVFSKDPNAPSKNPAKGIVENARVVLNMFNHRGDSRQRNSGGQPYEPTIDFTSAILYGIGFLYAVYYSKYYMFFILVMVFFSQAAGSIFSIEAPSAMRAVGTMVPAIFFIAFIFNKILLAFRKAIGKKGEVIYYPLLLAVFLIPIVKDNYNQYFGRWVGGMDELTTATGLYSRKLGSDWRIVMFTNTYFPGHPPFKISRNDKANTASRLTTALTYLKYVENDNFALLFHYDTWQGYDNIKSIYFPESKTEEVTHAYFNKNLKPGEGWGTFARALLVTNEDLKRRRGLMAEYSFGGPKLDNEMPEFKEQDKSKIPYKVIWTGAFMAPYYGRFAFINTGTARVDLVIDGKNIKTGEDVILAEGFHRIRITAYRSSVSDTISMSVRAYGLSAYAFRGSEVLKLDGRYLYNFPIYGLHGYYTNGNKWDTQSKDAEIIDTYMWFDGAIYSPTARWEGTINIPEEGEYLISASANGYVRIVIDGNRYWEQNSGSAQQEAANEYFSGKSMERVSSFKLRKGKHKISVFVMNSTILRLQWAKPGKSADPVPIQMLEPSLDISLK